MENAEQKVAQAILQQGKQVEIGGRMYDVTPPTPATLIMVSAEVSGLPRMEDGASVLKEILAKAQDCGAIGRVAALLILGGKRARQGNTVRTGSWWQPWKREKELDWMAGRLMEDCTVRELSSIITARLKEMQLGDFFALTTSLSAANVTKPTAEETQSGEW